MSYETARQAIVAEIERAKAAWNTAHGADLKIDYENRKPTDLAGLAEGEAYLMVDIEYIDAKQGSLGAQPLLFDYGTIALAAGNKQGSGVKVLNDLLDHFKPYLQLRDGLGPVRTQAAKRARGVPQLGFYYLPMHVAFWVESIAPPVP